MPTRSAIGLPGHLPHLEGQPSIRILAGCGIRISGRCRVFTDCSVIFSRSPKILGALHPMFTSELHRPIAQALCSHALCSHTLCSQTLATSGFSRERGNLGRVCQKNLATVMLSITSTHRGSVTTPCSKNPMSTDANAKGSPTPERKFVAV